MSEANVRFGNRTIKSSADLSAVVPGTWCKVADATGLAAACAAAGDGYGILANGGTASGDQVEVVPWGYYPDALLGGTVKAGMRITNDSAGLTVQATGVVPGKGTALVSGASGERVPIVLDNPQSETMTLTAAAEAANVIAVTVACSVPSARMMAMVCASGAVPDIAGAGGFTVAETGSGTPVAPAAGGSWLLVFTTNSSGAATLSVTDVNGASSAEVILFVWPVGNPAIPARDAVLTFDGA